MKQKLDSHPVLRTPDYDETLVLAIELSNSKWVLAAQVPGLAHIKNKRTIEPTVEALMAAIGSYRARAARTGRKVQRIIATYERDGRGSGWLVG
jgi:transposase